MWDIVEQILKLYGLYGITLLALGYGYYSRDKAAKDMRNKLFSEMEKRIQDNKQHADQYRVLSEDLKKSLDLIIKVVKNGG